MTLNSKSQMKPSPSVKSMKVVVPKDTDTIRRDVQAQLLLLQQEAAAAHPKLNNDSSIESLSAEGRNSGLDPE